MTQQTIPGPAPKTSLVSKIGLILDIQRDLIGYFERMYKTYGDIYALDLGGQKQILIHHPDHYRQVMVTDAAKFIKSPDYSDEDRGLAKFLGHGLLTSDGDLWRRQRKLVAPALHTKRIEAYAETMVKATEAMLRDWRDDVEIDVDHAMMRLTLVIVAQTLFSVDVTKNADSVGEAMTALQDMNGPFEILPQWVPTPGRIRTKRAIRTLNDLIYGIIKQRRTNQEDTGDLMSMLITAQDDDGSGMSDRQIRDETVTLFLAGHETTANALNWTWELLAHNPTAEAALHHELDTVLGGRLPTLADLAHLPYTDQVIKESLRLYPPAYTFSRMSTEALTLGETYPLPAGASVTLFGYLTHRDPRWWDEPDRFMPERFHPENEAKLVKYAYIPFGGGPRVCIGNSFAMMEARLILATVASRYRLRAKSAQPTPTDPLITLRPRGGMPMRIEARQPLTQAVDRSSAGQK